MTGQIPQTAGKPFPCVLLTKDPRFAYHGVSFAERGSWHGWGLDHYGRAAFAGQGGSACGQKQCAAAAGSFAAVQRAGAAAKCAAPDGRRGLSCPAAGRGLHGRLAGRRTGGAGTAYAHRPCTGGRRPDAGIHPVLCAAAGAAWAGEHCTARGCRIGARPIDLHLQGLAQMGVRQLPAAPGQLTLYAPAGLRGAEICLSFPSVGATETLLLAAATAQGQTVLHGAAKEPEIADLAAFLNACGGCVEGAGTDTIRVQGRRCLAGCTFMPVADRIIASTLACAAAAAGGRVELAGCAPGLYAPLLEILEQMGCTVERARDAAAISRFGALRGAGNVHTAPYPGLATDAAPLLAAVMLYAQGESRLQDRVFENRFACAEGFAALGANVRVAERTLYVQPGGTLRGAKLTAPDLRGGAALALAALAARGSSRLGGVEFVRRGYADLDRLLAGLGAQIWQEIPARSGVVKKTPTKKQFCLAIGAKK